MKSKTQNGSEINHRELKDVLKKNYEIGDSVFVWGPTGIGKSQTIHSTSKELAEKEKREMIEWNKLSKTEKEEIFQRLDKVFIYWDCRATEIEPTELRGLVKLVNDKEYVDWEIPLIVKVMTNPKTKGVIFFDEINLAPPMILAGLYKVINDRQISDYTLSEGVMVVSAGNRIEDRANVHELPAPLKDRFSHYTLRKPSTDAWIDWALENDVDPRIVTFIKQFPSHLFKFDPEIKDNAFPTPRSWKKASDWIKGEDDLRKLEIYISGRVGTGTTTQIISQIKLKTKIDLDKVLKSPEEFDEITKVDMTYACMSGLVQRYKDNKELLGKVVDVALETERAEFGAFLMRMIKKVDPVKFEGVEEDKERYDKIIKKYDKYMRRRYREI